MSISELTLEISLAICEKIVTASTNVDMHSRKPDLDERRAQALELLIHFAINKVPPGRSKLLFAGLLASIQVIPCSPQLLERLCGLWRALVTLDRKVPEGRCEGTSVLVESQGMECILYIYVWLVWLLEIRRRILTGTERHVMEARVGDANKFLEELEVIARPSQVRDAQTSDSIEDSHNLNFSGGLGSRTMRMLLPAWWLLETSLDLGRLFIGQDTVDPVSVSRRLPEVKTVLVALVESIEVWEVLHVSGCDDTDVSDKAGYCAGCIGSAGEAKAEDLVSSVVVEDDKVVSLDDITNEANSETSLAIFLILTQLSSANSSIVVNNLLPDLAVFVLAAARNGACKPGDIGGDVLEARHGRLPGAIAADNKSFGSYGDAGVNETSLGKASLCRVSLREARRGEALLR